MIKTAVDVMVIVLFAVCAVIWAVTDACGSDYAPMAAAATRAAALVAVCMILFQHVLR